jgi:hypothetical protein
MAETITAAVRNGVDTTTMFATLDAFKAQLEIATFQFRARNRWIGGAHNRSTIRDSAAAGGEDTSRAHAFALDAGEPAILLGTDTAPNMGSDGGSGRRAFPTFTTVSDAAAGTYASTFVGPATRPTWATADLDLGSSSRWPRARSFKTSSASPTTGNRGTTLRGETT